MKPLESRESGIDDLARAWAAADDADSGGPIPVGTDSADRVWRAVAGELSPEEVRSLAAQAASDPEFARAWRLARDLRFGDETHTSSGAGAEVERRWTAHRGWAIAATLVLGLGLVYWLQGPSPRDGETRLRSGEQSIAIEPVIADGASLPRAAFRLRWTPLTEAGTRYTLRVTTADLTMIAEVADLTVPEATVPPEALARLQAGAPLYWQVEAVSADGQTHTSTLFRVVLAD